MSSPPTWSTSCACSGYWYADPRALALNQPPNNRGFWERVAGLPGLSPVIDYEEQETERARYIHRLHLRAIRAALRPGPDPQHRFLDYGCGVGRLTAWLASQVSEVFAIDRSAAMIAEARRRLCVPNVQLLAVETAPRGLPALQVDGILSIWVLQHILEPQDFAETLDYLASALQPGGMLITLDRLCREPVPERDEYICLRQRQPYLEAFAACGLRLQAAVPISVGEEVLGSPLLSRWAARHPSSQALLSALDLRWAARQRDPFLADVLCRFEKT